MLNKNIVLKQQMARRQILALAILGGGMLVFFALLMMTLRQGWRCPANKRSLAQLTRRTSGSCAALVSQDSQQGQHDVTLKAARLIFLAKLNR